MSDLNNNNFVPKRVAQRYIMIFENVFQSLTPSTYKVYNALRFEADYGKDVSSIKKDAAQIAELAGVSRGKVFDSFNELENNGLLMRESKAGKETIYWIAQELNYFTKKIEPEIPPEIEPEITPVQNLDGGVQNLDGGVQNLDTIPLIPSLTCPKDIYNKQETDFENDQKETYQETYYENKTKQCTYEKFEQFWELYPLKKNKLRAKAIWNNDNLDLKASFILEKLAIQIKKDAHWLGGFVPSACNYLSNELWNDEISVKSTKQKSSASLNMRSDWMNKKPSLLD